MTIVHGEHRLALDRLPALACLLVYWVRTDTPLGTPRTMVLVPGMVPAAAVVAVAVDVSVYLVYTDRTVAGDEMPGSVVDAEIGRFVVRVELPRQVMYSSMPAVSHRLDAREGQVVVVYEIVFALVSHDFLLPVVALYCQIRESHPATKICFR